MSSPLISLIIPVYNVKDFLKECLNSVLNQTYQNLEIIIINDGSTDGSEQICKDYAKRDSRIILKHQKNSGLSAARNSGLELAKGKYVFFLDSDDFLAKDCLKYLVTLAESSKSVISICPHYERRGANDLRDFNTTKLKTTNLSVEQALKNMLLEKGFNLQITPKLYARELFEASPKVRFPIGELHEDVGTTYKLFLRAYEKNQDITIAFGAKPKYYYNIRQNSITNLGFDSRKLALISQTDEMCDAIDATFPNLKNTTNLRRLHARFSILRQAKDKKLVKTLASYIKTHRAWISKNPEAEKRDKLALASLKFGVPAFKLAWKTYELFFK